MRILYNMTSSIMFLLLNIVQVNIVNCPFNRTHTIFYYKVTCFYVSCFYVNTVVSRGHWLKAYIAGVAYFLCTLLWNGFRTWDPTRKTLHLPLSEECQASLAWKAASPFVPCHRLLPVKVNNIFWNSLSFHTWNTLSSAKKSIFKESQAP